MKKVLATLGMMVSLTAVAVAENRLAERIAVMDFGALDTLTELGAAQRIVALPKDNAPEYLADYQQAQFASTGGMKTPDIAAIEALKPDNIIISGRQNSALEALAKIAPVSQYTIDRSRYLESVEAQVMLLAKMVDKEGEAKEKWQALITNLEEIKRTNQQGESKALVVLHNAGKLMASNSGYASFIHQILGVKQADEALSNERTEVNTAYLIKVNPDIIFIIDRSAAIGVEPLDLRYFAIETLKDVAAVKNKKVIYLTPKLWYLSGNGLQSIRLQAQEVMQGLTSSNTTAP